MLSIVLLHCGNKRPIEVFVRFFITVNFSLNVLSSTSICISTVVISAFNCPLATIIWSSGRGPSVNVVYGAKNRFLRKLASGMALDKLAVSMSPSILKSPKPIGK